jgi:hypothetical protein
MAMMGTIRLLDFGYCNDLIEKVDVNPVRIILRGDGR